MLNKLQKNLFRVRPSFLYQILMARQSKNWHSTQQWAELLESNCVICSFLKREISSVSGMRSINTNNPTYPITLDRTTNQINIISARMPNNVKYDITRDRTTNNINSTTARMPNNNEYDVLNKTKRETKRNLIHSEKGEKPVLNIKPNHTKLLNIKPNHTKLLNIKPNHTKLLNIKPNHAKLLNINEDLLNTSEDPLNTNKHLLNMLLHMEISTKHNNIDKHERRDEDMSPNLSGANEMKVDEGKDNKGNNKNEADKNEDQDEELPEEPTTCCMSGCANCVWIEYAEKLNQLFQEESSEKAKRIILNKVQDPNMRAFLQMELDMLEKKKTEDK